MLPQIGGPETAGCHHADAGHTLLNLVEFGRNADHIVVRLDGGNAIRLDADLLEDRRTDVDLLDVAVEGYGEDTLVAPVTVIALIGFVEIVKRQIPLCHIFVERLQEALGGEITQPRREELDGVEAGIAGQEFGDDLVVHGIVGDRDQINLDAGEIGERLGLLLGRFTVSGADGEANRLAGVFLAHGFPVDGADPVLLRIPQLVIVAELVLVAVFLLDHVADIDFGQHVRGIRHLRIGAIDVEQRDAARTGNQGRSSGRG